MALSPGSRLGPYEIAAQIGVGGMGEVYRATDTNLKRAVAIKVLPADVSSDAERLARFQREAEVLASLNHPNIAHIHGLEKVDGAIAIVMELVEGPTLADRIAVGPIAVKEALAIAKQIAESLEAAHEQGIVHRDLKPANVKVRDDGMVKVLDFGLAKAMDPSRAMSSSMSLSPTITTPAMTQAGFIIGTAAYMSPEQARGKPVDRRADIWAFGCVLYEMLTGKRAFDAEDVVLALAKVLERDVDLAALPADVPPNVRHVIGLCLRKDVRQRAQAMGDVRLALDGAFETEAPRTMGPGPHRRPRWHVVAPFVALVVLAGAAIVMLALRTAPRPQVMRFQINAPPGTRLPLGTPAISPDGRMLAYTVTDTENVTRIHVRPIDRIETRVLPGTEGAVHPFWSPDGRSLAFVAQPSNQLKRIEVEAGLPRPLVTVTAPWHGTWTERGVLLFMSGAVPKQVAAEGGAGSEVTSLDAKRRESAVTFPLALSDGQRFLARVESADGSSIQLRTIGSAAGTLVLDKIDSAPLLAKTPGGKSYLLFMRAPDLLAQEFDEAAGSVRGTPVVLVSDIGQVGSPPIRPTVGVSPAGILAYQTGGVAQTGQLMWVDRSGAEVGQLAPSASVTAPKLSPDGQFAAGTRAEPSAVSIWVTDLRRGASTRLTFLGTTRDPTWSPDGTRLAYRRSGSTGEPGVFVIGRDGSGERRIADATVGRITNWSPDGKFLLTYFTKGLMLVPVEGTDPPITIEARNGRQRQGEFSPNGRYIAFASDESGRDEVYVQAMPPGTSRSKVSIGGGVLPRWRADGKELFFVSQEDNGVMAVDVETGAVFSAGVPHELFKSKSPTLIGSGYDVRADGKQFLMPGPDTDSAAAPITVVLNWWADLK